MDVDVIVVGSGGAGLTAALAAAVGGARVAVLERGDTFGGTTAFSGGSLWIPANRCMVAAGVHDSRDDAITYIGRLALGRTPRALIEAFVDQCNPLVAFLEQYTGAHFEANWEHPDYQPELPGARSGGRTLQGDVFDTNTLGPLKDSIRAGYANLPLTKLELDAWGKGPVKLETWDFSLIAERMEKGIVGLGRALVGQLMRGCLEHGATLHLRTRALHLVRDGERVVGVRVEHDGSAETILAPQGVILATGGFEWDPRLVDTFLGVPVLGPSTPPTNDGDGLRMAMAAGAALGNMTEAWWAATLGIPGETYERKQMYRNSGERSLPGSIVVNRRGRRFADEAMNYNDFGKAMRSFDPGRYEFANLPCFMVCDQQYRSTYSIATLSPGDRTPSWLAEAPTLRDLAERLGIDPDGLEAQVREFNASAAHGEDPLYHRGRSAYDHYRGDPRNEPNANVRPLGAGPYYGLELFLGTLGTKGGPLTNEHGQVLTTGDEPIPGLYAVGNVAANVFGPGYPGAGATLGSGMTFARRAGLAAIGKQGTAVRA